jgi:hypothetical protein
MNIKRLFSVILVLVMFAPVVYAANDGVGVITDLQLQKNEISIDDQVYTVDSSVKVTSAEDMNVKNIYQLTVNMGLEFKYQLNSDGTRTILGMKAFKELLP